MFFAGFATRQHSTILFILQDNDEAGYFYHDLTQVMGHDDVLFYPSSYRRAVKYGQRDAANEILRTEVLTRLSVVEGGAEKEGRPTYIVTCPEALSELVVSKHKLDERTLTMRVGQTIDVSRLVTMLRDLGFQMQEYVYEPGQFALRGSILDVYSSAANTLSASTSSATTSTASAHSTYRRNSRVTRRNRWKSCHSWL